MTEREGKKRKKGRVDVVTNPVFCHCIHGKGSGKHKKPNTDSNTGNEKTDGEWQENTANQMYTHCQ